MTDNRGVFFLNEVQQDASTGDWVPLPSVFTQRPEAALPDIGYNIGGWSGGSPQSSTSKLTFSNDTFSSPPLAALLVPRAEGQAAGNDTKGYVMGGIPAATSAARLTYASDTMVGVPGANLPNPGQHRGASGGTTTAGYFSGGNGPGLNTFTNVYRIVYSSETTSRIPGMDLTAARAYAQGGGNDAISYVQGQAPGPTNISSLIKQTFATETSAAAPSNADITGARYRPGGGGTSVAGYFAGGNPGSTTTVDRITIATDTRATLPASASLETGRAASATTGNNSTGYFMAGNLPGSVASNADKLVYATDTMSTTTSNMPGTRYRSMGLGPKRMGLPQNETFSPKQLTTGIPQGPNTGYFTGGGTPNSTSFCDKIDLSTETTSAAPNLPVATNESGTSSTTTHGYIVGGSSNAPQITAYQKLAYATDSATYIPGGDLTAGRYGVMGAGNQDVAFFTGGFNGSVNVSTTEKTTYSSDTTAAAPGSQIPGTARRAGTRMGNQGTGYFSGGGPGGLTNTTKITYSNDAQVAVPSADLAAGRYLFASTGTDTAGYAMGGFPSKSSVEKITWATETYQTLPGASLRSARYGQGGTGNNDFGYAGGSSPGSGTTDIDKIDFASETRSNSPANLSQARRYVTGVGSRRDANPQKPLATPTAQVFNELVGFDGGYYLGGQNTSGSSTRVDKLSFTTDTCSGTPNLQRTTRLGGTPGGFSGPTASYANDAFSSHLQKVLYSTDATSQLDGILSGAFYNRASLMSRTHGYLGGGGPGPRSTVDKFAYADETRSLTNPMTIARQDVYSVNNSTHGYFCGGNPDVSTVSKYTFSSDTDATIPAFVVENSGKGCGVGNGDVGYLNSGANPSDDSTRVSKITYSTDTISAAPDLAAARYTGGGCSNSNNGYMMGGSASGADETSTVQKIVFATETYSTLTSQMTENRARGSGTGPRSNDFSSPSPVNC